MAVTNGLGRKPLCALGLAVFLSGCATPPVPVANPGIPSAWPRPVPANDTLVPMQTHWRQFFRDPRLQALISEAMAHNRDLRMAIGRVNEARAAYEVASADRLPTVTLSTSQMATRFPAELAGGGVPVVSRRAEMSLTAVSFELDFWGRVSSLSEAAQARFLASEEARRALRITLIATVANHYFSMLELDQRIALSRTQIEGRRRILELQQRAMALGAAARSDVLLAEAALNTARAELAVIENQRWTLENSLTQLIGKPLDGLPEGLPLAAQDVRSDIAPGLPSEVIAQRPDVIGAELRLKEAHANVAAARAAFLPRILLTAGLGFASRSLATLFLPGSNNWTYQPALSLPLFDGGRASGQMDVAEARQHQAVSDYERTIQQAFREIADLLASRESLANQRLAAEASARAQQERLIVAEARFKAGTVSYLDVLDAQREMLVARQGLLQVQRAQLVASAQLYKALGGGLAGES